MDIRQLVGANVRKYRVSAGISQEELAAQMDVDQGYVSRLEAGDRNPTIATIAEVARALGIGPSLLFEAPEQPVRKRSARHR